MGSETDRETMISKELSLYLDKHETEFLKLRLSGIGYTAAVEIMKERFEKETN